MEAPLNKATFIVDGYNVMHSILSRRERAGSLEQARAVLEARLEAFGRGSGGARILLVYDGARGVFAGGRDAGGLEVIFSRPPRTADDVVIDLCRKLDGSPGLHVVTSDLKDIASRVGRLRLRHLTAGEFGRLVAGRIEKLAGGRRREAADAKPGKVAPEEVDDWVRKFGFEDSSEESP
jgi:predicted RNA-binding protein with PIN domain